MKLLRWLLIVGIVGLSLASLAVYAIQQWQQAAFKVTEPITITVSRGESFANVAKHLSELGVIDHPRVWSWLARLDNKATYIQPGEYQVTSADSPTRLLDRLTSGDVVRYQFRIQEGWIFAQALAALDLTPNLTGNLQDLSEAQLVAALGHESDTLEGSIFPETYSYTKGQKRIELLQQAHTLMQAELQSAWGNRSEGTEYQSPEELLKMASIIEKESGLRQDLADIAQVFNNRLRLNMRLQTDPTVIYGLGERFKGNLTRAHLRMDTPYNTYLHKGLPPTPISLPGRYSLDAAANPSAGGLLYFVARGDGTSEFSTNLADHNAAVRRFQLRK